MKSSKSVLAIQVHGTAARDERTGTQGDPGAPVSRNRKLRLAGASGLTDVATGARRPRESSRGSTTSVALGAGNPESSWRHNVPVVRRPLR